MSVKGYGGTVRPVPTIPPGMPLAAQSETGAGLVPVLMHLLPFPTCLFDERLRVVAANMPARLLLAGNGALRQCLLSPIAYATPVSETVEPRAVAWRPLRPALERSLKGEARTFAVDDGTSSQPLRVCVVPVEGPANAARVLLTVQDPVGDRRLPEAYLRSVYGLTPAECDVAACVLNGASAGEIAQSRRVSTDTVRKQLKSIFEKTATAGQVELVRVLMALSE